MKNPQNIALGMIALICILVIALAIECHEGLRSNAEYNKPIHDTVTVQYKAYRNVCEKYFFDGAMSPANIEMGQIDSFFDLQWKEDSINWNKLHNQ